MKQRFAIALSLAMMALSHTAAAQTPAQAKRFGAAQKLYDQGAYTPAYQEFKALAEETRSPNAELQAARCLRELGKLPEAYEAMSAALRNATARAESEPKYAATRNAAAADLALLEPKVGKIIVAVDNPPPGLTVTIDGIPLPEGKFGVPVATAIGEIVVRLRAPDYPDVERRVQIRGGQPTTVALASNTAPAVNKATPQQAPSPPSEPATTGGGTRIGGFVVLGLGAAGLATFAGAGVAADKRYDDIKKACGNARCTDPSFNDKIAGGRTLDIVANVGLGVGIAGIAAGTLMVVLGGPKAAPPPVSAWISPGSGGIVARGSF